MQTNTAANRNAVKYTRVELFKRILWTIAKPLFRLSPRIFFGWRRFLLRLFGAQVGHGVHIYSSANIYIPWNLKIGNWSSIGEWALVYNLGPIEIGSNVTISQRAHLCAGTHDYRDPTLPLSKPPIIIKEQAWICADAFVGPGIIIGEGAIVGARAVVVSDVGSWQIVAGNPAKVVKQRVFSEP